MLPETIINVRKLTKKFGSLVAVDNLDLQVKKGEVFGFLGPNGSGKTTTIRMICGLLTPTSGEGTCLGFDVLRESDKIKPNLGYMTQKFSFYTDLTVLENLQFISRVYRVINSKQKIKNIMADFGLTKRQNQKASELSGGWKQRLALAACLLHSPKLLLLDEPTSGIDPIARREIWDTIHALSVDGVTTLMSTHYMDEAERCTRLAYIAHSQLIITGTVDDVIKSTKLLTFEIKGEATPQLLKEIKKITVVNQAVLFGRSIHVCVFDKARLVEELEKLQTNYNFRFYEIESTLEDAFLSLVSKTNGSFD